MNRFTTCHSRLSQPWTRRGVAPCQLPAGTATVVAIAVCTALLATTVQAKTPIEFEDVTQRLGISDHLVDWELAHAGAWGDIIGNGLPDLYLGAFADYPAYGEDDAPMPNMLFLNRGETFELSSDEGVRFDGDRASASMALFVDLNNNGRLDLLVGTHNTAGRGPGNQLFANAWPDDFRNVTGDIDGWPDDLHMRNATAIDLDRDGLLDLVLVDGRYKGDQQSVVALRNRGEFQFEDVSGAYGFPPDATRGLGSAVGDVNNDGRLDLFVADANRMFITQNDGTFSEYEPGLFAIPDIIVHDWPCGAAFADLTGNGLLDMVLTIHGDRIPEHLSHVFVYVNRGIDAEGMPQFEEVTQAAGLRGFRLASVSSDLRAVEALDVDGDEPVTVALRAAQIALVDVDNNGRRDILLGMVREDEQGRLQPVVLRNLGAEDGVPRFEHPAVDSVIGYYATAPVADYDRDGRMDIFLANWHDVLRSHLFRNVTEAGNWLVVRAQGEADDLNPMGVGATVRLYAAGEAGDEEHLIARGDITLGNGYSVGEEAMTHFGLGNVERCDVVISWQGYEVTVTDVEANQYLDVPVGDDS